MQTVLYRLCVSKVIQPGFSEKHDEHRLKPHKIDIPRHNYLFQMRDDKSSSKSLFYGISYDIIVTFSRIQDTNRQIPLCADLQRKEGFLIDKRNNRCYNST